MFLESSRRLLGSTSPISNLLKYGQAVFESNYFLTPSNSLQTLIRSSTPTLFVPSAEALRNDMASHMSPPPTSSKPNMLIHRPGDVSLQKRVPDCYSTMSPFLEQFSLLKSYPVTPEWTKVTCTTPVLAASCKMVN